MPKKPREFVMVPGYGGRVAGDLEFRALRRDWEGHISLLIQHLGPGPIASRQVSVARSVSFETLPEDIASGNREFEVDPTLKLRFSEAQQLMDELWRAGCRPAETVTDSERAATRQHLDDMRTLLGATLDVNLPIIRDGRRR